MGTSVLDDLKRKAHALFARAGFTAAPQTVANAEGVLPVGPEDLVAAPAAG